MIYKINDLVQYWFNDGIGGTVIYGKVKKAGLKQITVKWESCIMNKFYHDTHLIKLANNMDEALKACKHL